LNFLERTFKLWILYNSQA